jgi:hypothetical protein
MTVQGPVGRWPDGGLAGGANGGVDGTFGTPPGTSVEVRSRFDGAWCQGFEVDEVVADADEAGGQVGFRVRRASDGAVLPTLFRADEVAVVR